MLEVTALRKTFGGFVAVSDVSFTVGTQQIAAVIGPNGAGKSTLFNLITGHLQPHRGRGRDFWSRSSSFYHDDVEALLAQIGLQEHARTLAGTLSYGNQKQLEL